MHCWGIDIEAMNSKQGCLFVTQTFLSVEICFWFTNVLFPCYLNVEYDERISCWNPFQNLLT